MNVSRGEWVCIARFDHLVVFLGIEKEMAVTATHPSPVFFRIVLTPC